ncbi:unnamed protein product [Brassica oleracea var. botrytis]|uniref:Uncharacterized protein n=2 Tax=Brassica oleracea TaxID=3712 RepID=A0A0D3CAX8_BRAOL|nr:unnamed protein product [Brassica oleracea]
MSSVLWERSCSWERSMSIRWRELCTKTLKNLCHKELSLQHGEVLTNTSPRSRAKRFTFGIKRAQELAKEKAELALKNLSCLPRSGFRSALEDMVMFNLERIN